jgi:vancomycin aglycone glucosyltransferase
MDLMRVLLSTIGSRGDVQPLVALALELMALGREVRLCVPPDFRDWIDGLGIPVTPIGPELRKLTAASAPATPAPLSPERRRQMIEATVATQFETIAAAAEGCDVIVGATALQVAAPSVAERMGIPYVFAAYCPTALPSPHHAPIPLGLLGETPAPATADNRELWARDARRWNDTWGPLLNAHRASAGLAPVSDVRSYIFTDRPWLASDSALGPWPDPAQTRPCSRPAPGSCRTSVHCPPSSTRSSKPASLPSTSLSFGLPAAELAVHPSGQVSFHRAREASPNYGRVRPLVAPG